MALLHRPPRALRARLEEQGDAAAGGHPVAAELCALLRFIHGRAPSPAMTCTTLRQRLFTEMQKRGYENPADGQPRDAAEMLKALLEILKIPDTLRVQRHAEIQLEGEKTWRLRGPPSVALHGTVWTAHLPSTARTVGQALHSCDEQEVEACLDDEDMEQMARLHGAALPTPATRGARTP